jgi:hypothetical protein
MRHGWIIGLVATIPLLIGGSLLPWGCGSLIPRLPSGVVGSASIEGGPAALVNGVLKAAIDRPLPHAHIVVRRGGRSGAVVSRVRCDARGRFRIDLRRGRYTIQLVGQMPVPIGRRVTVRSGGYAVVGLIVAVP